MHPEQIQTKKVTCVCPLEFSYCAHRGTSNAPLKMGVLLFRRGVRSHPYSESGVEQRLRVPGPAATHGLSLSATKRGQFSPTNTRSHVRMYETGIADPRWAERVSACRAGPQPLPRVAALHHLDREEGWFGWRPVPCGAANRKGR